MTRPFYKQCSVLNAKLSVNEIVLILMRARPATPLVRSLDLLISKLCATTAYRLRTICTQMQPWWQAISPLKFARKPTVKPWACDGRLQI